MLEIKIKTRRNFQGFYNAYIGFISGFGATYKQIVWDAPTEQKAQTEAERLLSGAITGTSYGDDNHREAMCDPGYAEGVTR